MQYNSAPFFQIQKKLQDLNEDVRQNTSNTKTYLKSYKNIVYTTLA